MLCDTREASIPAICHTVSIVIHDKYIQDTHTNAKHPLLPPTPAADSTHQRHFLGHTSYISAFAIDVDATLLVSAQEGRQAIIRLWDYATGACVAILNGEPAAGRCAWAVLLSFTDGWLRMSSMAVLPNMGHGNVQCWRPYGPMHVFVLVQVCILTENDDP